MKNILAQVRADKSYEYIVSMAFYGVTWKELGDHLNAHHGTASGILSKLHEEGRIVQLEEKRRGSAVYVTPGYVDHRPTVARRKNVDEAELRLRIIQQIENLPTVADAVAAIRSGL